MHIWLILQVLVIDEVKKEKPRSPSPPAPLPKGEERHTTPPASLLMGEGRFLMNAKTQAKYEARARIIKAMAHPTRLFIVDELSRCPRRCVCELTEMVGVDMSTVSRHLAMLKNAGIIVDEKRGAQVYYSLRMRCVLDFFECVESVLKNNAKDQQRLLVS
jgi:DNA-binding transcriptional ArsR family regulator